MDKAQVKVTFEINPAPSLDQSYTIRIKDSVPAGLITVKNPQKVTFKAKSSTAT